MATSDDGREMPGINQDQFFYRGRAKEFVELHDQVQTSVNLLDSLEAFLSTFQKDLSSVSGQIADLQDRSKDIDNRLKSRRRIEKPLSDLLSDLTIPPPLASIILDSAVGDPWIQAIEDFERRLDVLNARSRVKAARDLADVAEGLRIVAATKLRAFFLALLQPIRNSVTTNMQVIQTSIFLKYRSLYAFLQRQAANVAQEIQRAYVVVARTYYETAFRRYIRSLGWIKARTPEKLESIVLGASGQHGSSLDEDRLAYAKIEGPSVILAYMADDKAHKEPVEAVLRSLLLVLMDNATAEYTFVTTFFPSEPMKLPPSKETAGSIFSPPTALLSPDQAGFDDRRSNVGSEVGIHASRLFGEISVPRSATILPSAVQKSERAALDAIWKQILDPVLEYCKTFLATVLEPLVPAVPLLTMIRLTEEVVAEVQKRDCAPLESFLFTLRLQMWPAFQKAMSEHYDALKKLAEGTTASYFSRAAPTTDASVSSICSRYIVMFNSFVMLTEQEEETMIFSNLLRLRQELTKLITRHTDVISDDVTKATKQSTMYEVLLQGLSKGTHLSSHPNSQKELAYWAEKEEEARRRIISVNQARRVGRR
ncbi:Vps52-domain-containing protein [Leucogyrophana mollusca]|uniref:Vps52-domain-containing protein n=1 Tax=Leucogyrophana mollusca TaxID=85980 RepID=A0ACB8BZR9_9AGAM|nr:Vps52-domain-containing protein [Leucogyrophana mollusca]